MLLKGKTIALGVTGGIAAYKACELVRLFKKQGADVHVIMTKNACQFVMPLTFEVLSGNRVITDMFDRSFDFEVEHISLAKKSDLFVVAPATANIIGKVANGIADDFLSTTLMATKAPIVFAPAMNTGMLESPAYRANEKVLKERGYHFVQSDDGFLACGDSGKGRLADINKIVEYINSLLSKDKDFLGKTVLIASGATRTPIDPVRFITNRSSGKMGLALANAFSRRGAKVIVVLGTVKCSYDGFETIMVDTTEQMHDAVLDKLSLADIVVMAAAPSDYKVINTSSSKLKDKKLLLELEKNPDIALSAGKIKGNKRLVIFAAETENLSQNAKSKLIKKNADLVIANDVTKDGAGFDSDTNIVTIIGHNYSKEVDLMSKEELADVLLDEFKKVFS